MNSAAFQEFENRSWRPFEVKTPALELYYSHLILWHKPRQRAIPDSVWRDRLYLLIELVIKLLKMGIQNGM